MMRRIISESSAKKKTSQYLFQINDEFRLSCTGFKAAYIGAICWGSFKLCLWCRAKERGRKWLYRYLDV